jgi:hypothetical protein
VRDILARKDKSTKHTSSPRWYHQRLDPRVSQGLPPCFLVAVRLKVRPVIRRNIQWRECTVIPNRDVDARVRKRKCHMFRRSILREEVKWRPSKNRREVYGTWPRRRKYRGKYVPVPPTCCRDMQCRPAFLHVISGEHYSRARTTTGGANAEWNRSAKRVLCTCRWQCNVRL